MICQKLQLILKSEDPENKNRENKKDMNDIINKITKMRIEQRVYKMKTNKQIDEELVKWKIEKIQSLRQRYVFFPILFRQKYLSKHSKYSLFDSNHLNQTYQKPSYPRLFPGLPYHETSKTIINQRTRRSTKNENFLGFSC